MSTCPKSQIQKLLLLGKLYVRIYLRPVVLGAKYNEKSFEKGPETLRSLCYLILTVVSTTVALCDNHNHNPELFIKLLIYYKFIMVENILNINQCNTIR